MSIRDIIRNAIDGLGLAVELWVTEQRTGISRIEALAAGEFETTLHAITTSEEERHDLRVLAIEAAKLGLTSDDLAPMAVFWYHARALNLTDADLLEFARQRLNDND